MKTTPTNAAIIEGLKAQLAQVDALIAQGVLQGAASRQARGDLEQQVLAAVLGKPVGAPPEAVRAPRGLVAAVTVFVLAFGLVGYAAMGNRSGWTVGPGDNGEEAAQASPEQQAQVAAMTAKLVARLKAQPEDADGWAMLARSYSMQGKYTEALEAHKKVMALRPQDAQAMADYADGLAMVNNRSLEGEPEKLILQAVQLDPSNVKALALAGTVAFNRNNYAGAVGYWEHAIQIADPTSGYAQQLQGALAEARQRAGLPAAAATPAPSPFAAAPPAAPNAASGAATGATVSGRVSLKEGLKAQFSPDDTVFIYARAPSGSRMPLAILKKRVRDLPLDFSLDDSLAMSPAARLSTAPQVIVSARISKTGNAMPSPGDWQAESAPVAVGANGLRIEIGEQVQ